MRFVTLIAALIALLLSPAGSALAAAGTRGLERVASCSWDRPGHNPFMGNVVAAVDRYADIPPAVRQRLKQRMQARQYDDLADIRRDDIIGAHRYEPTIRDMHFGLGRVCREVTRAKWSPTAHERGLVYCEEGHCILVPTVCRNVSRIQRRPTLVAGAQVGTPEQETPETAPRSFAQGVDSAALPLWPTGGSVSGAAPDDPDAPAPSGPSPWWPSPPGGGGPIAVVGFPGGEGGGGGGDGGSPCGAPAMTDGGRAVALALCPIGSGGGEEGGGEGVPLTPIPEPSTWLSLLAGLALLAAMSARRQRRCGVPSCATQKRS